MNLTHLSWLDPLKSKNLTRTDRESIKRYESNPAGKGFISVSECLYKHGFEKESIELLIRGVDNYPEYTLARVILVRELFKQGMVIEAWRQLQSSTTSLVKNQLAQKLRLKIAALLGSEPDIEDAIYHLNSPFADREFAKYKNIYEAHGIEALELKIRQEFSHQKVELLSKEEIQTILIQTSTPKKPTTRVATQYIEKNISDKTDELKTNKSSNLNFSVMSLKEVFHQMQLPSLPKQESGIINSTTLAEIYAKQGHHKKSLHIYRSLLQNSPNNDSFKKRIKELKVHLQSDQVQHDLIDLEPAIGEQVENLQIIDKQINFYQDTLNKLRD